MHKTKTNSLAAQARAHGLYPVTLRARLKRGSSLKRALTAPIPRPIEARTKDFVERSWHEIEVVAAVLAERSTLSDMEVRKISTRGN
jgi:hypothetical protein